MTVKELIKKLEKELERKTINLDSVVLIGGHYGSTSEIEGTYTTEINTEEKQFIIY